MNEPILCLDNMAERFGLSATPSGVSSSYLTDQLHYTLWHNIASPGNVQIDMSGHAWVDTIIVDSMSVDSAATIATTYDGGTTFVATVNGLSRGTNLIRRGAPVWTSSVRVLITTALGIEIRHIYIGLRKTLRYAKAPFARKNIVVTQETTETDGISFVQSVKGLQKTLDLSIGNMSISESSIADELISHVRIGRPFWYFAKPDSEPLHGSLFALTQQELTMPYQFGKQRRISLSSISGFVEPLRAIPLAYEIDSYNNVSGGIEYEDFSDVSASSEVESMDGIT